MGNTVGNAVSSKQEETTGSMKRLSHLSCFMWLMGTIHSSIHPFFPSVNKDVWVPSICQTLVQVLKMQQWTKQVRSLPDGACSVTMKVSFSAVSPFVWETTACAPAALRLIAPPSRTGPQEALPATHPLEGRGCSCWQRDQCRPVPCCLPSSRGKILGNMSLFLLPEERQERCTRELRGVMDRGPVEVNHCPAWRARRRA